MESWNSATDFPWPPVNGPGCYCFVHYSSLLLNVLFVVAKSLTCPLQCKRGQKAQNCWGRAAPWGWLLPLASGPMHRSPATTDTMG